MSTPRHVQQPTLFGSSGRAAPRREDTVVRQRLRVVAGAGRRGASSADVVTTGGRPALAWHPVTGAIPAFARGGGPADAAEAGSSLPIGGAGWLPERPGAHAAPGPDAGPAGPRAVSVDDESVAAPAARAHVRAAETGRTPDVGPEGRVIEPDDLAARARRRAASTVAHAYAAVHGHPATHAGFSAIDDLSADDSSAVPDERRTTISVRVAVAAALVVLVLGGTTAALALRPDPVVALAPVGEAGDGAGEDPAEGEGARADGATGDVPAAASAPADGTGEEVDAGTAEGSDEAAVTQVVVHVVGQVVTPGLVDVPTGARVADALAAAGGTTADADLAALNLARTVVDGEQIVVPRPGEAVSAPPSAPSTSAGGAAATPGTPVDLNQADAAALDALPGIGPVLAERIVAWRDEHGRFTSVEELGEVSGIGPAILADVRDLVRV